jgi:type I restriction enzyme S subunit
METKKYRFDEVTINHDKKRKPLSAQQRAKMRGRYRYFGAQNVIDYVNNYLFDGEYLLIAEDGENLKSGKQNIAQIVEGQFWLNNHAHIVQTNELCNIRYLEYWLNATDISAYITGSAQPKLSQSNMNAMEIELPERIIQDKIVNILSSFDKKIEVNNQINRNLSEQAMAIFTDLFGDADKDATVDEVSLNVTDGVHNTVKDDSEGKFFLLSCKNIKGGSLSLGEAERRINQETFEKLRKRTKLEKGDILLSSVGTIGELLLMSFDPDKYEFQRSVAIIKPNSDVVSSEYLYCALLAQKQEIIRAAHGAVQQCIFISDIKGFTIHKPTSERLIQFDNAVVPMMKMIYQNEEENKRLSLLRDTLLPKLMSGELDVSELDI